MKLELRSIVRPGELAFERLTLRAKADLDIGDYLVAQTGWKDDAPTTTMFQTYWFPFKKIERGDLIVIYTKEGRDRVNKLKTGKNAHFYYLDLDSVIWDDPRKAALVLYAPEWSAKSSSELS